MLKRSILRRALRFSEENGILTGGGVVDEGEDGGDGEGGGGVGVAAVVVARLW